jgi:hypothetical protein
MQIRFHPTSLHLSLAAVLLANMAIEAVASPTRALLGTRAALDNVFKHVSGLGFKLLVIVGAIEGGAAILEMPFVAGLSLVEARVVDGPFFLGGRAHVVVDALVMLVEGDIALCCACGETIGYVGSILGLTG